MVNPTYKHLDAKLRVSGLTLGQWAQLLGAAVAALGFGIYLSPLPAVPTIWLSVFTAGLPVALSYAAMGLQFSASRFLWGAWRWWRCPRRYLPGPGGAHVGYLVEPAAPRTAPAPGRVADGARAGEGLWER